MRHVVTVGVAPETSADTGAPVWLSAWLTSGARR